MDLELMENLSDKQVDELYADVIDGQNELIANRDDGKMWFCNAYIVSPDGHIHQSYVQNIYKISSYFENYINSTRKITIKMLFQNKLDYIYPEIGANKALHSYIIPDRTIPTSLSCLDLEECFAQMYNERFAFVQTCGNTLGTMDPARYEYYYYAPTNASSSHGVRYILGADKNVVHSSDFILLDGVNVDCSVNSTKLCYALHYCVNISYYAHVTAREKYMCNQGEFIPFYRSEELNNMEFHAYMQSHEYNLNTFNIYSYIFTKDASTSKRTTFVGEYKLTETDNLWRMHIRMECFR